MDELKLTVTEVTMHRAEQSPLFDLCAMRFSLDGGGEELCVRITGCAPGGVVVFDFDDLPMIHQAFEILRQAEESSD